MTSPARRHRLAVLAEQMTTATEQSPPAAGQELLLQQLAMHKRQLEAIQSQQARHEKKAEFFDEVWNTYIDTALEKDGGANDRIMSQMLPWCFDVADYDRALAVGFYGVRHNLPSPDNFQRTFPALFAEMAAETALANHEALTADQLKQVIDAVEGIDMVDEIRAKLYRAVGEVLADADPPPEEAKTYLERAIEYNPNVGAKPTLKRLNKIN